MRTDVRSRLEGLKTLLGVRRALHVARAAGRAAAPGSRLDSNRAGKSAGGGGVRMEKVAPVQAALAAGTYRVPARAVAAKMVDAMLASERMREGGHGRAEVRRRRIRRRTKDGS